MNFDKLIYELNDIDEILIDEIKNRLHDYNFCIIRGLLDPKLIKIAIDSKLSDYVKNNTDSSTTGESPSEIRNIFMKMSIGNARHGGVIRPRFKRVIYNPMNRTNAFGLDFVFERLAQVRNVLSKKDKNFAIYKIEEGLWTAARIHQFPVGGGFMTLHKDTVLPNILKDKKFSGSFFQPLALLTQKFEDFEKGGGIALINKDIVEYENFAIRGDIVIYDSNSIHGVKDIDTHLKFEQRSIKGRISGLATLYEMRNDS